MSSKRIAMGSVTKGFNLKTDLKTHLEEDGYTIVDVGCYNAEEFVSYTSVGEAVAHCLHSGDADFGIIICNFGTSGTVGSSKFQSVCAINCESPETAAASRKVNNANVLCLGSSVVSFEKAREIVDAFISAEFLDIEGVPERLQEFRKLAHEEVVGWGEVPESRELKGFN